MCAGTSDSLGLLVDCCTDEYVILFLGERKLGDPVASNMIMEVNPFCIEPWDLPEKSKEPLNFSMRLCIAMGFATGILYLHTEADPSIFHHDIKASNILLDSKFVAKVADFGLSRLAPVPDNERIVPGHVSTVVKGTPGYLDLEYLLIHKLTDKSDVYSLGVVFLELLTGIQPISHGKNIVREITYGFDSCIMGQVGYSIHRLIISVIVQLLCSYSTLPLYAIVTQFNVDCQALSCLLNLL